MAEFISNQARMQGGCEGVAAHPQKKANLKKKSRKKEEKINKIKKSDQNYHYAVYKWVKTDEFSRG